MNKPKQLPVFYDDEPTAEQVAELDRLVAEEFAKGDWLTDPCMCCGKPFAEHGHGGECWDALGTIQRS